MAIQIFTIVPNVPLIAQAVCAASLVILAVAGYRSAK